MCHKAICFAVALSCIMFLPPRVMSQDANESNRTREAPSWGGARTTSKVVHPVVQTARHALGKSTCTATFEECRENLSEFKEAQQFMKLKAAVYADLNRLEKSRHAKPKIATVRDADVNRQKTGNGAVYSATVGPNGKSSVQATSAVQPVSLESAAAAASYKRKP
jgi:hypothetical protein